MAAPAPPKAKRKRRRTNPGFGDVPTAPRRVAVYLRRSTDDEHQPFSITAQDTALASYITTQPGWTLVAKFSDDASAPPPAGPASSRPCAPPGPGGSMASGLPGGPVLPPPVRPARPAQRTR